MVTKGELSRSGQTGYTLVIMVIVITIVNVLVASAWPLWSAFAQREREEELIFRGLQYAEAIRVFQLRFGRYPNRLEELVDLEPRCLRQLWEDPMTEDGKWGLVFGGAGRGPAQKAQGAGGGSLMSDIIAERTKQNQGESGGTPLPPATDTSSGGSASPGGNPQGAGPITGVYSKSDESGFKTFFGQTSYREWRFTADLVSQPPMGANGVRTPHIGPRTLGRAFAGDIGQPGAGGPGAQPGNLPGGSPGRVEPGARQPLPGGGRGKGSGGR